MLVSVETPTVPTLPAGLRLRFPNPYCYQGFSAVGGGGPAAPGLFSPLLLLDRSCPKGPCAFFILEYWCSGFFVDFAGCPCYMSANSKGRDLQASTILCKPYWRPLQHGSWNRYGPSGLLHLAPYSFKCLR